MEARRRSRFTDPAIDQYSSAHSTGPDRHQVELQEITREQTGDRSGMQIGDDQAVLMEIIVRAMGAKRAVEVGTFTGYSALAIARGLGVGGRLLCCDVSEEWTAIARDAWKRAVGGLMAARHGIDAARDCVSLPAAEGENAVGALFVKQSCELTDAPRALKIIVRANYFRKTGQKRRQSATADAIDPGSIRKFGAAGNQRQPVVIAQNTNSPWQQDFTDP